MNVNTNINFRQMQAMLLRKYWDDLGSISMNEIANAIPCGISTLNNVKAGSQQHQPSLKYLKSLFLKNYELKGEEFPEDLDYFFFKTIKN